MTTSEGETADLLAIDSSQAGIAEARRAVESVLARACPAADRFAIVLVLSELLTNAVRHAAGRWRLRLRAQRGQVLLEVSDEVCSLPTPREPDLVNGRGGLGLHLVRSLTSRVEVERDAGGGGKTIRALWFTPGLTPADSGRGSA